MPEDYQSRPLNQQPQQSVPPQITKVSAVYSPQPSFRSRLGDFYRANKLYFWGILIGLTVIGLLSYFAFKPKEAVPPTEANVSVTVDSPQTVGSGSEAIFRVKIENKDTQNIEGLRLDITYPNGVSYVSSSPKADNSNGSQFTVPSLMPGQNAAIILKAKVSGSVNDTKELRLKLTYKFSNFSLEFAKEATHSVRVVSSDIAVEISGPEATSNAQLVSYEIKYKNSSKEVIQQGRIVLTYPEGFVLAASQPDPDQGKNIWNVIALQPDSETKIVLQGTFASAQPGESKTLTADFQVLAPNGEYNTQSTSSFTTQLSSLPLLVTQEADHVQDGVVQPGDSLTFSIRYQNNSSVAARGVNIVATLDSKALDLASLQAEGGSVSNNSITWNAASVSQLENLKPNESGTLSFSVDVKNPPTKDSSKSLSVVSNVKIKSNEYETFFPGNELRLKIATQASVESSVSFVSGSLPPQVGRQSAYKVTVSLKNSTNDISDAVFTAFIPLGAGGFDQNSVNAAESSKVQYDPTTGKLTWNVGSVPAHSGSFQAAKTLQFNVRLQPSASQVGESPVLVRDLTLSGTDVYTSQQLSIRGGNITTSDLDIEDKYTKGQVVP